MAKNIIKTASMLKLIFGLLVSSLYMCLKSTPNSTHETPCYTNTLGVNTHVLVVALTTDSNSQLIPKSSWVVCIFIAYSTLLLIHKGSHNAKHSKCITT